MNRKIVYIDVGNIPTNQVMDYVDNIMRKNNGLHPIKRTKWEKFKKWLYDWMAYGDFTTLGIV